MLKVKEEKQFLTCGCCGNYYHGLIPKENGIQLYDNGVGMCPGCGGDPKAKSYKKKIGWGACAFYEARFDIVRDALSKESKAKFEGLSYQKKVFVIQRMLKKGIIKW